MTKAEKQKKFWEKMAERYSTPFSKESLEKTGKVTSMAEQREGCRPHEPLLPPLVRLFRLGRAAAQSALMEAHGLNFGPPLGAKAVQAGMGIHVEIETVRRTWDWEGTVEEAFEHVEGFIESQSDTEPQPDLIQAAVAEDGKNRHQTEMEIGMMVWQAA